MATVQYWIKTNYKGVLLTLAVTIVGFSLAYVLDFSSVLVTLVIGMMLAPWVSRPNVCSVNKKYIRPSQKSTKPSVFLTH